ncbi:sensor histidine kinase [Maricaulis parjimensis]|uniref:sensor histidine kinase n=1 Tax=Maricaulis parjimensis TaxID=144023 RepID=UPI00193A1361|nr:HAMP domain-containing sensor histidine kinase [Maricaulis parjimensis]
MVTDPIPDNSRDDTQDGAAPRPGIGRLIDSLPGQLFMVTVGLVFAGVALVFFPAAASFRVQWMSDRAEAAHLAALAADVAPGGALGENEVRALLMGADAVAVSRVRNGMNELVLYSGPIEAGFVESDLRTTGPWGHVRDTVDVLFAPSGRLLRIRAEPMGAPGEVIDVIVRETQLQDELHDFSRRLLLYAGIGAVLAGAAIYAALFHLFVRPMRRLAGAMTRFSADPSDPARMIRPSGARNEIGQAEAELARMQSDIRTALSQRERLAALGGAVAKINHDLRNVLASTHLVSDRLAMDSDERVRRMGERLVRAIDRGIRLCEATLEFGRAEETPPSRQPVPARALADEVSLYAGRNDTLSWSNDLPEDLVLDADPDQVHRIFLNLFRNAVQALDEHEGEKRLAVCGRSEDGYAVIEIIDTGPGLPAKARDNLFKAFTGSTRRGGTGLGLSIARELARGHEGDVELVRTGEDGTVFAVRLPVAAS